MRTSHNHWHDICHISSTTSHNDKNHNQDWKSKCHWLVHWAFKAEDWTLQEIKIRIKNKSRKNEDTIICYWRIAQQSHHYR